MATYSTNLDLIMPDRKDNFDVGILNKNTRKLDKKIKDMDTFIFFIEHSYLGYDVCIAEYGMTLSEWAESDYCTNSYTITVDAIGTITCTYSGTNYYLCNAVRPASAINNYAHSDNVILPWGRYPVTTTKPSPSPVE